MFLLQEVFFYLPDKRWEETFRDPPVSKWLQDPKDRWPIRIGWLKQELNLMPHFLPEMRQALWAWPLPRGSLSVYTAHVVISHIAVSLNPKIISNALVKAKGWKNPIWKSYCVLIDLIISYFWCQMWFYKTFFSDLGGGGRGHGMRSRWKQELSKTFRV